MTSFVITDLFKKSTIKRVFKAQSLACDCVVFREEGSEGDVLVLSGLS